MFGNESCYGTQINVTNSNYSSITCSGEGYCYLFSVYTMHSTQSSIICNGLYSCCGEIHSLANLNDTLSYLSISFNGSGPYFCGYLYITTSDFTMLDLDFYGGFAGRAVTLNRSHLTNFTKVTCDHIDSCRQLSIGIQPSSDYVYDFNINVTLNGQYIDKFAYIYLNIYCVAMDGFMTDCTNVTAFPIFDIAVPSHSDTNSVYYISDNVYSYRYQSIILDENESDISNYYVECNDDYSCSQTFIQFKAKYDSNCTILCNGDYSCTEYIIYSMPTNNSNISVKCEGTNVCGSFASRSTSIIAFFGNELIFIYNTEFIYNTGIYITGSDGLSMYIYITNTVCNINATNAKVLNVTLNMLQDYGGCYNSDHDTTRLYGPISNESIFDLLCANHGCQCLALWLPNGLNDVNVSFTGDCDQCHLSDLNRTECIDEWYIYCSNESQP
eukprot:481553_1